ncbi:MAG TPA: excinuclease ABC subunit UvrC [Planctomycetota bacterium]|nr:excinuclease ABC subunit UvrC [Planctomycetota bacterium]
MAVPDFLKPQFDALPDAPGVYIYKDDGEHEIYVGKAVSLRKRVRQYFDDKRPLDLKTADLVSRIRHIDFIECQSEVEAFLLENRLIKDLQPQFNMRAKSDVNFPVVEVTDEEFPRIIVTRDRSNKASRYYGPFVSASWLRTALQILQRVFKYRTCNLDIKEDDPKNRFFRPCLEYHIGRCKAPCAGLQTSADYKADLRRLTLFLQGRSSEVERDLEREMKLAAKERRYEEAAGLRDTLKALQSLRARGSLEDEMEPGVLHIDPKEGVSQLNDILKTPTPPRRIEGIDIAHLHGSETVGSLVSFVDGLPSRERYRRFRIKTVAGVDDFASIREIVSRRYGRMLREGSPLPDLILIDGGLGQLHAAQQALRSIQSGGAEAPTNAVAEADVVDATPPAPVPSAPVQMPYLASLAKKEEIIHTLDHPEGIRLPRRSPALRMLQYVRDEAHRFARHYHHILRRKRVLDE